MSLGITLATLTCAPAALADTTTSSNWAGYAVHRSGVSFHQVTGSWLQPSVTCTPGKQAFSAFWVGLGGYSATSNALEQVGTEADCSLSGKETLSAWYELVPAPSHVASLKVHAGDLMSASVSVTGHNVALVLSDQTRHVAFRRTFKASSVDLSSAEWIVEAPSNCVTVNSCVTLPLADFGSASFRAARVQTVKGRRGTISNPGWNTTKIKLAPGTRRFAIYRGSGSSFGTATPSPLTAGGSSFEVAFDQLSVPETPFMSVRADVALSGRLVHPTR